MINQILVILFVIAIVWFFFIKKKPTVAQKKAKAAKKRKENIDDEMLECRECGVYVSQEEAILSNGLYYCSDECLKAS
ncbi:MAG: hypothetical protein GQ570_10755 [Helicobacteraceae bacterium]|nr:hypothetical protein [Helicobacteraceae bacterium]